MTDNLKERLKAVARCDTDSAMRHFAYAFMEQDPDGDYVTYAAAKARITDLEARLAAAEAGEDALAKQAIRVMASLAAAISLLGRGGKAAKKAAPSDKMFDQMLKDYRASLEAGRAALAAYEARRKG